ncbi:MAG: hypothetical protein AAF654_14960 [Myxococcota bacterium]
MKVYGLAAVVGVVVLALAGLVSAQVENLDERRASNLTRACIPAIGDVAVTLAATTATDADSGALGLGSVYMLQCDTDAWIRWGSSAVTAAADDWKQPAGVVSYFATGAAGRKANHVSALSVSADGDCRLMQCF